MATSSAIPNDLLRYESSCNVSDYALWLVTQQLTDALQHYGSGNSATVSQALGQYQTRCLDLNTAVGRVGREFLIAEARPSAGMRRGLQEDFGDVDGAVMVTVQDSAIEGAVAVELHQGAVDAETERDAETRQQATISQTVSRQRTRPTTRCE